MCERTELLSESSRISLLKLSEFNRKPVKNFLRKWLAVRFLMSSGGGELTGADTEFRKRGSASNFGRKTARGSWGAL